MLGDALLFNLNLPSCAPCDSGALKPKQTVPVAAETLEKSLRHPLGKGEVESSILSGSTIQNNRLADHLNTALLFN